MNVEELYLRQPNKQDFLTISSWIRNADELACWAGPQFPYPFHRDELGRLLQQSTEQSYVLSDQYHSTLGFGQFRINGLRSVHLCRIIIAPPVRGLGLGKRLCRLLIAMATKRTQANQITLRVYRANSRALATYRALGFSPMEELSDQHILTMQCQASLLTPD